jgi:hypothetical protein
MGRLGHLCGIFCKPEVCSAHTTSRLRAGNHVSIRNQHLAYLSCAIKHTRTDAQNYSFGHTGESRADTLLADLGNVLCISNFLRTHI